ncbi:FecR family protein [Pedobacter gandavensis]|uniref:FecR family protein n=1 Tax=Pedobacter TaxID=84567 RepID=UPI001C99E96E|nr:MULTISPECIES: FecR family protein [Pedobacter]WGQ08879.1 FecR family protein [Pedobacter gandavensis]
MKKYKPEELIHNYLNGTASNEERIIVESWHIQDIKDSEYLPSKEHITDAHKRIWDKIDSRIHRDQRKVVSKKLRSRVAIAASLVLISSIVTYNYLKPLPKSSDHIIIQNDVLAGGNRAILTLNNGQRIILNQTSKELIAVQGGISIRKSNGLLIYDLHKKNSTYNSTSINRLETPRGGKYQILLPDGTKVWLNSASILTYPNSFKGSERKVSLKGEAYFEVARDKKRTFKVVCESQTIEVLGTHFNIKSYEDEYQTQTTLAKGKVKILKGLQYKILKPGQAAFTSKNSKTIQIESTDLEKDLAWKNNEFIFNGDDLMSIMREVSRWYDVKVIYKGDFNEQKYFGVVSRSKNISEVLKMLQLTGKINFKIEGRRITLMN